MSAAESSNKRWWLSPLLMAIGCVAALVTAWHTSEVGREILAKALMNILGAVSTPFILEATFAIFGLCLVMVINQWRLQKEGDGWVYLAQTEPDPTSVAEGANTPPHRLDSVILEQKPDIVADFEARIAIVEGYLALGLKKEALEHLDLFTPEERNSERVRTLYAAAETTSA